MTAWLGSDLRGDRQAQDERRPRVPIPRAGAGHRERTPSSRDFFGRRVLQTIAVMPLEATHTTGKFDVRVNVRGGGIAGQAGAVRHGIARALCTADENLRTPLKRAGFLTRDARKVERKKAGFHKARKKPEDDDAGARAARPDLDASAGAACRPAARRQCLGRRWSAKPGKPTATAPKGTITTAKPTFTWSKAKGAAKYELRVYKGTQLQLKKTGLRKRSWTSSKALPIGVDLSWKVRASNARGAGAWSRSLKFRIPPSRKAPRSASRALRRRSWERSTKSCTPSASTCRRHQRHSPGRDLHDHRSLSGSRRPPQTSGVTANDFTSRSPTR